MSGGYFGYRRILVDYIVQDIQKVIDFNEGKVVDYWIDDTCDPDYREYYYYSPETLERFREGIKALRVASVYANRIDWLLSDDDGEEEFHKRLAQELSQIGDAT